MCISVMTVGIRKDKMFHLGIIIFLCLFIISFICCFVFCDYDNNVVWPVKSCVIFSILILVCMVLAEVFEKDTKTSRVDCLCNLCNKMFQVKSSEQPHVLKISPFRAVYVCDTCFYTHNNRGNTDGIKEQDTENK